MASASGGPGPTAASGGPGPAAASAGLLAAAAGGWPGVAPGSIGGRPLLDLREAEGAGSRADAQGPRGFSVGLNRLEFGAKSNLVILKIFSSLPP